MQRMKRIAISLVLGTILISGCTSSTTLLEENWGRSVETAYFNQTIDPQAGETLEPIEGIDGQSAIKSLQDYRGQFKSKASSAD